ncbi:MAG: hypothetical protein A2017_21805 [Lentisphaerae bacterium GWF2_44_16]|nr:MAG: hypothetical protein A2017_21805 [Lentisphaerae bacterium GWF2_44_16]
MNKRIESCRETALSVLKPSKKDLEHGLELHKNSLVWDAYGFAPTGPYDCEKIYKLIDENASPFELIDNVEEMRSISFLDNKELMNEYKEAWEISGVKCIFQNAGAEGEGHSIQELLKRFARFTYLLDSKREIYRRSVFPEDIETAYREGLKTLYLTTNGVPFPTGWHSQEDAIYFIRIFFQLGCRMMHLTYNRRNFIGDGCGEKSDGGLSELGRAVIREMNRVGIIPDVAHSGQKTSFDAAKVSEKPVVASHSTCNTVTPHCRAKTDEVIKAIADSGGYIGICAMPGFLKRSGNIDALIEHIDYAVKKFGAEHVAIGTDATYSLHSEIPMRYLKSRQRFAALWPEGSLTPPEYQRDNDNNSLAWTNWPLFTVGLVQKGYSDDDIRKIIGLNVMRVAKETLKNKEKHE